MLDQPDRCGFDLIVNATPLGLNVGEPLPFAIDAVDDDAAVFDILMKDRPTPLLQAAWARGLRAWSGHEMLVQQASATLDFFGFTGIARAVAADPGVVRNWRHAGRSIDLLFRFSFYTQDRRL